MMRAPRFEDWMRNQAEYRAIRERENELIRLEEEAAAEAVINRKDDLSWQAGERSLWSHVKMLQKFEWFLRNVRGVPQEKLEWLCDDFEDMTPRHLFNFFLKGPGLVRYGGYPFPLTEEQWTSEDCAPRWKDPVSGCKTLSNKVAMEFMFNKIINDKPLMIDFCVANARTGGKWQFWPLVDRYMNCFGVNAMMESSGDTFEEFNARNYRGFQDSPPSDYELSGTVQDLSRENVTMERASVVASVPVAVAPVAVAPAPVVASVPLAAVPEETIFVTSVAVASIPGNDSLGNLENKGSDSVGNQGLETQPRTTGNVVNGDDDIALENVRATLVEQFDAVGDAGKEKGTRKRKRKNNKRKRSNAVTDSMEEDERKPAAKKDKKSKSVTGKK
ncbi:unknown protein [Seminavis robusta]|uniref:Uncharacterized protein n=1 Tax=Seminavis robusta TaxID=568900 RepID=A0A9N8F473_9STRA|nr:unknown protein [Seminavis robusta]|eukprot:Sro2818_g337820.1 n/a (388) ;mRNA; r:4950-6187